MTVDLFPPPSLINHLTGKCCQDKQPREISGRHEANNVQVKKTQQDRGSFLFKTT